LKERITHERAEVLALEALAWLAGQADGIAQFLTMSGLAASDLRQAVNDRNLQGAALEFLLANEKLLLDFCDSASVKPPTVHLAHHLLEGPTE
jgi:hypothetical protein